MDVSIRVVAYSFPTICLVLGFVLLFFGETSGNSEMAGWGAGLIVAAFLLYIAGIVIDYSRSR